MSEQLQLFNEMKYLAIRQLWKSQTESSVAPSLEISLDSNT